MLGAGRVRRFRTVELPLMRPASPPAAGLVLLSCMKELPATLLLAPIGFQTLATRIWSSAENGFLARGRARSLLLVAASGVLTWVLGSAGPACSTVDDVDRRRPARRMGAARSSSRPGGRRRAGRLPLVPRRPDDGRRAAVPAVGDQPGRGPRPRHRRRAAARSASATSTRPSCPARPSARDDGSELSPHDPLLPLLLAVPVAIGGWVAAKVALAAAGRPARRGHDLGGGPPLRGAAAGRGRHRARLRPRAAAHRATAPRSIPSCPPRWPPRSRSAALTGPLGRRGRIVLGSRPSSHCHGSP